MNVTTVQINCTDLEWLGGSSANNVAGVYGTIGTPATTNQPGSRLGGMRWTDAAGNLWLFGGYGYDSAATLGYLSDLWKYNPTNNEWTWISGSNFANVESAYTTPFAPGGREFAVSWVDGAGNFWLFGGYGMTVDGDDGTDHGDLNDLWRYSPTTNAWTFVGGGTTGDLSGVYGTLNVPAAGNAPGARDTGISWVDASGNLWMLLNDLWEYNPGSGLWTWVNGSNNSGAPGVYGAVPPSGNVPGGRWGAVSWTDKSGNFWLFSGTATFLVNGEAVTNLANDLWQYTPSSGLWTFVSGSTTGGAPGVYGSEGVPAPANVPGARSGAVSWLDVTGNLWLYGGNSTYSGGDGTYTDLSDDLWEYTPATAQWNWVAGVDVGLGLADYGTMGVPEAGYSPGALEYAMSWTDPSGNLWLFAGESPLFVPPANLLPSALLKFTPFNVSP
jgi:hypothetical protein